jgi:hypothetical protein
MWRVNVAEAWLLAVVLLSGGHAAADAADISGMSYICHNLYINTLCNIYVSLISLCMSLLMLWTFLQLWILPSTARYRSWMSLQD